VYGGVVCYFKGFMHPTTSSKLGGLSLNGEPLIVKLFFMRQGWSSILLDAKKRTETCFEGSLEFEKHFTVYYIHMDF